MTRFGKLFLAVLLLAGIGFVAMLRFGEAAPEVADTSAPASAGALAVGPSGLVVPVAGVRPDQLADSFGDARGAEKERSHGALDIMAPRGTPVVAADAGKVEKIFESGLGGHTVYVRSADGRFVYYYAHLDGYAPGLHEGQAVARGATIGSVGSTGDASPDAPHLHFQIKAMAPGEAWHEGRAINPFPLLARAPA